MILCADIMERVAEAHDLSVEALRGPCRRRQFAWPRQEAFLLCREMAKRSLPDIGRRFGNRDHTTVISGLRSVEKRIASDAEVRRRVDALSVGLLI
jgi:chromosomal replication initiator protein